MSKIIYLDEENFYRIIGKKIILVKNDGFGGIDLIFEDGSELELNADGPPSYIESISERGMTEVDKMGR